MDLRRRYRRHTIGRHSYGSPLIHFENSGARLHVGQFCSFAEGVQIFLGGEHRVDWITTYPFPALFEQAAHHRGHPATKGDVIVGNDVWLGRGATLLSGVTISDGAVVGAGAVVGKDVAPFTIVGGNPARPIRSRFSAEQIDGLLRIGWWNWPLDRILQQLPTLLSGDLDGFIAAHGARDANASAWPPA